MKLNNINLLNILNSLEIIYIEDEKNIRENITITLQSICKNVFSFEKIEPAMEHYNRSNVDIIITDITLENENGLDLVKQIRQKDKNTPILILSAHTDIDYLLDATSLKLVEYLIKPVNLAKLENALINCVKDIIENGNLFIKFKNGSKYNIYTNTLMDGDKQIHLSSNETMLLNFLVKNIGTNISSDYIKNEVWQDSYDTSESAFKSLLNKLRNKIGKESIQNTSGVGYQLIIN